MFKITKVALAATIGLATIGLAATTAHANISPTNGGQAMSVVEIGGSWKYTYGIFVDQIQTVKQGSFFTFYDIDGYIAGSASFASIPTNVWARTEESQTAGVSLDNIAGEVTGGVADRANLMNVKYVYTGSPDIIIGAQPSGTLLGTFSFTSIYGPGEGAGGLSTRRAFAGRGFKQLNGAGNINLTTYDLAAVPEPSEYAFMGFTGISLCGLVVRARRRRAVVAA